MQPAFRLYLTHNATTSTATALTLDAALAVAKAFEVEHAGDPEAYTSIRELDGTHAGLGTIVHSRWMGEKFGPRDERHPMQVLMSRAIRSGERVVISDGQDTWRFNYDFGRRAA